MRNRWRIALLAVPVLWLAGHLQAEDAAARAAKAGELVTLQNQKVLRLFGKKIKERGFAHGYFLAAEIRDAMDDALKSLPLFTAEKFEKKVVPWARNQFVWDAAARLELEGIFEGMQGRLGARELVSPVLNRAVTLDDLYGINVIADWFGPACSGFAAWDTRTEGGKVVHGRNLDFPIGNRAVSNQVVLACAELREDGEVKQARPWVGVGWPGLISIFSAMNDKGLVCCIHDATNVSGEGERNGLVARGVLLRRMLEQIDPERRDPAGEAAKMAAERPVACGNLFHLSWPRHAAEKTETKPSAVLEFDGTGRDNGAQKVHIRRMDGDAFVVVTNHYCQRHKAIACPRFDRIAEGIRKLSRDGATIDLADARKIMIGGEVAATSHTLVFLPDERTMQVAITRGNFLSTRIPGATFTFDELNGKK